MCDAGNINRITRRSSHQQPETGRRRRRLQKPHWAGMETYGELLYVQGAVLLFIDDDELSKGQAIQGTTSTVLFKVLYGVHTQTEMDGG